MIFEFSREKRLASFPCTSQHAPGLYFFPNRSIMLCKTSYTYKTIPSNMMRLSFQGVLIAVRACLALRQMVLDKQLITVEMAKTAPYKVKTFRKLIDGCAFRIYGHWVQRKRDDIQNRGALFENHPKMQVRNGADISRTSCRVDSNFVYSFTHR